MSLATWLASYDTLPSMQFASNDYTFMVNETLEALNINSEAESTDRTLHLVAKIKFWERVVSLTSSDMDYNADGSSFQRSQVNDMARKNLTDAVLNASQVLPDYQINIGKLSQLPDPYIYEENRAIFL